MRNYKARGIVLHTIKYGENSLIAYILTDIKGRQTYIKKVSRTKRSSGTRSSSFQPMFLLDFIGMESDKMEMHRMKDVALSVPLRSLPFDIRKSSIALFMAEFIYRVVRETDPGSPIFDFVWDAVQRLDRITDGVGNFHLWFLVNISFHIGFYPGNEYSGNDYFDIGEGHFTPLVPKDGNYMDQYNSGILAGLMGMDPEVLGELKMNRQQRVGFINSFLGYLKYHLDAIDKIRSVHVLNEIF